MRKLPEHLESDPGRREKFCPISIQSTSEYEMTIPELQTAIIASSTPSQALSIFYKFCGSFGINSNAPPEWWTKISELTEEKKAA
jgi:hypothetical protein|tara:strand:- start:1036 stop:1290 length:255 start_codon:yes stop_codon:yes gene_type:complete